MAFLQEGRDFVYEHGNVVLTREYLLGRGYCCKNRCRNCPYGFTLLHRDGYAKKSSHADEESADIVLDPVVR